MIGYVALLLVGCIIVGICLRIDNWQRDWTTNHAELDESADDVWLRPFVLARSHDEAVDLIRDWAAGQRLWTFVGPIRSDSPSTTTMHLIRTTPIFRFVDDIHVTLTAAEKGVRVTANSRSRVGSGDLGQNPRNLKTLVRGLSTD